MKPNFYTFTAKVWLYPGDAPWHFITVPSPTSAEITQLYKHLWRGWRSLPIEVLVGKTRWRTSIFLDSKAKGYLLPLKAEVRKKEGIISGQSITCTIEILEV